MASCERVFLYTIIVFMSMHKESLKQTSIHILAKRNASLHLVHGSEDLVTNVDHDLIIIREVLIIS